MNEFTDMSLHHQRRLMSALSSFLSIFHSLESVDFTKTRSNLSKSIKLIGNEVEKCSSSNSELTVSLDKVKEEYKKEIAIGKKHLAEKMNTGQNNK